MYIVPFFLIMMLMQSRAGEVVEVEVENKRQFREIHHHYLNKSKQNNVIFTAVKTIFRLKRNQLFFVI